MEDLEAQLTAYRTQLQGLSDIEQYVGEHDSVRKQLDDLIRTTEEDVLRLKGLERSSGDGPSDIKVGDTVLALFRNDSKYYEATVDLVLASGTMYLVTFHGSYNKTVVRINEIKKLETAFQELPLDPSEIVEGAKVRAKYAPDGKYYSAEIRTIEPNNMVKVVFLRFGDIELVSVDDLMKKRSQKKETTKSTEIQAIPDGLKIMPTDDPKERLRKKKAVKAIKRKNHEIGREREDKEKVASWKIFQQSKRRATSSITDLMAKEQSVFASSDTSAAQLGAVDHGDAYWKHKYGNI